MQQTISNSINTAKANFQMYLNHSLNGTLK